MENGIYIRSRMEASDGEGVVRLCRKAGNFTTEEIALAEELFQTRQEKGRASGYFFLFAQEQERVLGYACHGPVPCTDSSWDLYWLVVDPSAQRRGVGSLLMNQVESEVVRRGGASVYVDTSSRSDYQPARGLYRRLGYAEVAELTDFYRPGDHKIIFRKRLSTDTAS